jgi:hypothetical protein
VLPEPDNEVREYPPDFLLGVRDVGPHVVLDGCVRDRIGHREDRSEVELLRRLPGQDAWSPEPTDPGIDLAVVGYGVTDLEVDR